MNFVDGLVSVIVPMFNSERFIKQTIESVLNQTYQDFELILVDDASSDSTVQIASEFLNADKRVSLIKLQSNHGAGYSRNSAIEVSRGQYLAFLDADDLWLPKKLKSQIAYMESRSAAFCFTAYELIREDTSKIGKVIDGSCPDVVDYRDMLLKKATLGCSTVIIDRRFIAAIEMPQYRTGQDYALWLRILKDGWLAYSFKENLSLYRIVANSISRNKFKKAIRQWNIYRIDQKLPIHSSIWYFSNYAWRALFRS